MRMVVRSLLIATTLTVTFFMSIAEGETPVFEQRKLIVEKYAEIKRLQLEVLAAAMNDQHMPEETRRMARGLVKEIERQINEGLKGPEPKISLSDGLKRILREHEVWLASKHKQGHQAYLFKSNLSGMDLFRAKLAGAILGDTNLEGTLLREADLSNAYLWNADLSRASLRYADLRKALLGDATLVKTDLKAAKLQGAYLFGADLNGAELDEANLQEANLGEASLMGADLHGANLRDSYLGRAKLQGVHLGDADLTGARMPYIDFDGVILDLKPGGIPLVSDLGLAKNLSKLAYEHTPLTLVELRTGFRDAGMLDQEREITFAIEHTKRLLLEVQALGSEGQIVDWGSFLEARGKYYLFELPSDWGMSPFKPIELLFRLAILFSIPYGLVILATQKEEAIACGRGAIWAVRPEPGARDPREANSPQWELVDSSFYLSRVHRNLAVSRSWLKYPAMIVSALLAAAYFSIISSFHFGWRDLSLGTWLSRIQPRDYTLRATGRVKFVSGVQSIVSLYLLALWMLTYFGRPFD